MSSPSTSFDPAYVAADRGPNLQVFCINMAAVTVLSISLRFLSRGIATPSQARTGHRFGLDDWFALAAVPWVISQMSLSSAAIHDGFGRHLDTLPGPGLLRINKYVFILYFLYDGGLFFTKESALAFLSRVFPRRATPRWFYICLWVGHGLNLTWLSGVFFGTLFTCDPIAKSWNDLIPGHCGLISGLFVGSAVPSVFIDLFILVLPLPRLVEPAISVPVVCLPAMLPLGRFLMDSYFSPLFSLISTAVTGSHGSRRGQMRSRSGDFTTSTVEIHCKDPKHPSTPRQPSTTTTRDEAPYDLDSLSPVQAPRPAFRTSPYQNQYKANVRAGGSGAPGGTSDPSDPSDHAIRVDNIFSVTKF
ncbi:hypothetical protein L249_1653 [Ophiocordyceps polyrhachis-furcata BCC 54312]|uniref:Rhodopsin domain-containing protein n=1 Tax=Ophiocordyceps polyrhachis-furcata BCC 54312 TaxID=1330021 RepID=A0A367L069_9HYPO|nr:hypothetical protein L249_1653 [Ophiocordyceps polyrhachis-furcata BCC 54312]